MERKWTTACKQQLKWLLAKRKGYTDTEEEREGIRCGPGMFWVINEQENLL